MLYEASRGLSAIAELLVNPDTGNFSRELFLAKCHI